MPDFQNKLSPAAFLGLALGTLKQEVDYRHRFAKKVKELHEHYAFDLVEAVDAFADPVFFNPRAYPKLAYLVKIHTPLTVAERYDQNIPFWGRAFIGYFERRHLLRASHLYAPSHLVANETQAGLRLGERNIDIIANVPPRYLSQLKPLPAQPHGKPVILFVGRIVRFKGIHVLLDAVPKILDKYPEAQFYFAGSDFFAGNAYKIPKLKARIASCYHANLHFLGHIAYESLEGYYHQADLCVIPSLFDAFAYTGLEAMAYAKAIVASDKVGILEYVDKESVLTFPAGDSEALARQIIRLLDSPDLQAKLGARVHQQAKSAFDREKIMAEIEAYYAKAIAEKT